MISRAADTSMFFEYMRYAATIAALRPGKTFRIASGVKIRPRTHSGLTMDKDTPVLLQLRLGWEKA